MQYEIIKSGRGRPLLGRAIRTAGTLLAAGAIASGICACSGEEQSDVARRYDLALEAYEKAAGKDSHLSPEERDGFLQDVGLAHLAGLDDAVMMVYWGPSYTRTQTDGKYMIAAQPEDTCLIVRTPAEDYPVTEEQLKDYIGK
ncbi:MAG: hypothetical protein ABIH90_02915 [Candidatus Aenigmatarchaeota archaeon]